MVTIVTVRALSLKMGSNDNTQNMLTVLMIKARPKLGEGVKMIGAKNSKNLRSKTKKGGIC